MSPSGLLKVLPHVLVKVPLECYPEVVAVCRAALHIFSSKEFRIERACTGWGPETLIFNAASSAPMVHRVLHWLATFPNVSFPENQRIQMEWALEESDIVDIWKRPPFRFAQLRVGGSQAEASKWHDKLPHAEHRMRGFEIDRLDPVTASPRLRDAWWSVARSIFDGTPLHTSLTTVSVFSSFDSDKVDPSLYESEDLRRGKPHKLACACFAAVVWDGQRYGLLMCDYVDFQPLPYCSIKAWGGIPGQWLHHAMMSTITEHVDRAHTFASVCAGFQALSRQSIQSEWHDRWTFAQDTDWANYLWYAVKSHERVVDAIGEEGADHVGEVFWNSSKFHTNRCPFCRSKEEDVNERDDESVQQLHVATSLLECDTEANEKTDADPQEVHRVLEESVQTALQAENGCLVEAIMRSKADAPLTSDGVVLMRLKRVGSLSSLMESLLCSEHLKRLITHVIDAGCEPRPAWTPALLLVPLTKAQVDELGMELSVHHIIALDTDKEALLNALRELPSRRRASIVMPPSSPVEAPQDEELITSGVDTPVLEVVRTFLNYDIAREVSEISKFAYSALCGDAGSHQPANTRRWG